MRLTFSPQSAIDLEEIGDFIACENPARAVSFLDELDALPTRDDLASGLRMAVHGNYLILFRVVDNTVRIERIVHGARITGDLL